MLALLTCIRKLLTRSEEPPYTSIIKRTHLLQILDTVFSFEFEQGDMQNMKLEGYWILNNLACSTSSSDIKFLLGDGSEDGIGQYETLIKIETELKRIKKDDYIDAKTMRLICSTL
jgi:hypothetical protein